jgi:hypothetical protein
MTSSSAIRARLRDRIDDGVDSIPQHVFASTPWDRIHDGVDSIPQHVFASTPWGTNRRRRSLLLWVWRLTTVTRAIHEREVRWGDPAGTGRTRR